MVTWALAVAALLAAWLLLTRPWAPKRPFSEEYRAATAPWNAGWQRRRRLAMAFTFGRDPLCPWWAAREVDHLTYRSMGREMPWFDVVPLSKQTHAAVTVLRRMGLKAPVNFVLRLAYGSWIALELYAVVMALQLIGIVHNVPGPIALAQDVAHLSAAIAHVLGALVNRAT